MSMKMASRMTTTRAGDMEGTMGGVRMAGMDTGMTHTGSSSITTTATTMNDIRTKKTCGDLSPTSLRTSIDSMGK